MFALLGAGGGQQNSGNSAGLQTTTQSILGTNASSVGRNCNLIFAGLAKKTKQYSLAILRVPTSGTGKMAGAQLNTNSISSANVDCTRIGPELCYRYMDIVEYMILPLIFLFQMAFTFKTSIVPFLVQYFCHNMFVVIGWEDYVIRWS
jgi:hypothetical protein